MTGASYQRPEDPWLRIVDKVEGKDVVMAVYAPCHVIVINLAVPLTRGEQGEIGTLSVSLHPHTSLPLPVYPSSDRSGLTSHI